MIGIRDILFIVLMGSISAIVWVGGIPLELYVLDRIPPELPETDLEEWKASFQYWARIVVAACLMSIIWYILARWCFKVNKIKDAGKRLWWGLFALIPIIAAILGGVIGIAEAKASLGLYLSYLFFGLNVVVCYYLSTLLFSPSSFKYTPLGASAIRRW